MRQILLLAIVLVLLVSCDKKTPEGSALNKNKSIEITYNTRQLNDSLVLLTTHQNVYVKGKLIKAEVLTDTLPTPGDSLQMIESADGSKKQVKVPNQYEFFVTVK